ncbi:MAG: hypothetical protein SVW77_03345 [Candidatus Nanohaloarchaea archaeon]|nr:hypothetical protein [Candidatus Nanohaloarchaea archaeon]
MRGDMRGKRGQVSIEYLAIFGLVLLAIVGAVSFISGTGFLSPCQATTPSFAGQSFTLEEARFTGANNITVSISATGADLEDVGLAVDVDGDGTYDYTNPNQISSLAAGAAPKIAWVDTGSEFSSGECASMTLAVNYSTSGIGAQTIARGSTSFTRTIQ